MLVLHRFGRGAQTPVLLALVAGCSPSSDEDTGTGTDSSTSSVTTAASSSTTENGGTNFDSSSGSAGTPTTGTTTSEDGGTLLPGETGTAPVECDFFAQDCPDGEKCMPWANDGGNSWNAAKCSPVDPNPDQLYEPCTVGGNGVSGIDSCDFGLMCWNIDPVTLQGECYGLCGGSPEEPTCVDEEATCAIINAGILPICYPPCDPLVQDCTEGVGCYAAEEDFVCAPDASGRGGYFGEPCQYANTCDPGFFCVQADLFPDCAGEVGCCTPFCDLTDEATCLDAPELGLQCVPYFEDGQAPPGYEHVGFCAAPP